MNDAGFNDFLDRSIGSVSTATTLSSLPARNGRSLNLDQLQVSGALGDTFQLGGAVQGGTIQNLRLAGDLHLGGKLIIGEKAFTIDGRKIQMVINDGFNDRVIVGRLPNA